MIFKMTRGTLLENRINNNKLSFKSIEQKNTHQSVFCLKINS